MTTAATDIKSVPDGSLAFKKMTNKMLATLLVTLAAFFSLARAQGPLDGYMKGAKHLDVAVSYSGMQAEQFSGANGGIFTLPYRGNLLSFFAEYGVTDRLDVVVAVPYVYTSQNSGLQDGGVYLKYRPVRVALGEAGYFNGIAGIGSSFPLSDYEPVTAGALGQKAVIVPVRAIFQFESKSGIFLNLSGGYNWRLDEVSERDLSVVLQQRPDYQVIKPKNYVTFLAKIGLPAAHYYLDAWIERQVTQGGADFTPDVPDLPQAYGVSYWQFGGTAYYSDNGKTGFYISFGKISGGRNVSRIFRLTGGIVLKLDFQKNNAGHKH